MVQEAEPPGRLPRAGFKSGQVRPGRAPRPNSCPVNLPPTEWGVSQPRLEASQVLSLLRELVIQLESD